MLKSVAAQQLGSPFGQIIGAKFARALRSQQQGGAACWRWLPATSRQTQLSCIMGEQFHARCVVYFTMCEPHTARSFAQLELARWLALTVLPDLTPPRSVDPAAAVRTRAGSRPSA